MLEQLHWDCCKDDVHLHSSETSDACENVVTAETLSDWLATPTDPIPLCCLKAHIVEKTTALMSVPPIREPLDSAWMSITDNTRLPNFVLGPVRDTHVTPTSLETATSLALSATNTKNYLSGGAPQTPRRRNLDNQHPDTSATPALNVSSRFASSTTSSMPQKSLLEEKELWSARSPAQPGQRFRDEELKKIIELRLIYNQEWKEIAEWFPGRSWQTLLKLWNKSLQNTFQVYLSPAQRERYPHLTDDTGSSLNVDDDDTDDVDDIPRKRVKRGRETPKQPPTTPRHKHGANMNQKFHVTANMTLDTPKTPQNASRDIDTFSTPVSPCPDNNQTSREREAVKRNNPPKAQSTARNDDYGPAPFVACAHAPGHQESLHLRY